MRGIKSHSRPQILLVRSSTLEQANHFLRELVFSLRFKRTVNCDTVSFLTRKLQIEPVRWCGTLAGCSVTAHQHLDGTLTPRYGPHYLGRYDVATLPLPRKARTELGRGRGTAPFPGDPIPPNHPTPSARVQL